MRVRQGNAWRLVGPVGLVVTLGLGGCEDPEGFARVERQNEIVASFNRVNVEGKARIEYFGSAPQKDHPEFLVNWTNLNREIVVELYIFRRSDYDAVDNSQDPPVPNRSKPPMQLAEELTAIQKSETDAWEQDCEQNYPNENPCPVPRPVVRVLWPLLPLEGPQFGNRLPTQLHLHPTPDDWVFVFFNPLDRNPVNRAQISGSIELSYFSLP